MTCPTADKLRFAWYATVHQYGGVAYPLPQAIKDAIVTQRDDPDYQQALENLRRHFEECEKCQKNIPY